MVDELDRTLKKHCSKTAGYSDNQGKNYHHITFRHALDKTPERK